ncbi:hypothetical protein ISCGN_031395 [Ixodes scapularis]
MTQVFPILLCIATVLVVFPEGHSKGSFNFIPKCRYMDKAAYNCIVKLFELLVTADNLVKGITLFNKNTRTPKYETDPKMLVFHGANVVKLGDKLVMLGDKLVNLDELIIVVVKVVMLGARTPKSARDSRSGIPRSACAKVGLGWNEATSCSSSRFW